MPRLDANLQRLWRHACSDSGRDSRRSSASTAVGRTWAGCRRIPRTR